MGDQQMNSMKEQHGVQDAKQPVQHLTRCPPLTDNAHGDIAVRGMKDPKVSPFLALNTPLDCKKDSFKLQKVDVLRTLPTNLHKV